MIIIADAKGNVKPYFYLFLIFCAAAAAAALLRGGIRCGQLACQLFQCDAVDILVDHLVQPRPERQGEALLGHGALVGHAAKARNGRYAALDGAQDLAGGVVGRVFCQAVAALTAPLALDQPHPRQRGDDLLQIFQAQVLPFADLLQADGGARRIARQLRHQAQGVAALGGKFHGRPLLAVFHSIARYSDFAKEKPLVQTKKVCYHRMEQNLSLRSESMTEKITAADAIRLLDSGKAVAVDVREPDEYAVGHIPGAKLLPLGQVIDRAAEVLPDKNALWLVYCRTGRRSADAVQKLEALGYTDLRDLGGILSWPYEIEGDFEGHF